MEDRKAKARILHFVQDDNSSTEMVISHLRSETLRQVQGRLWGTWRGAGAASPQRPRRMLGVWVAAS